MLTHCPACQTHFRVTADQLKARSGRVRCGQCQHVFNALDTLIEEPAAAVLAPPPAAMPKRLPAAEMPESVAGEELPEAEPAAAPTPEAPPESEAAANEAADPVPALPAAAHESGPPDPEPAATEPDLAAPAMPETTLPDPIAAAAAAAELPATAWQDADQGCSEPDGPDSAFAEAPPPPRRWPWVIGSLLALAALTVQAALAYRVELAVLWPEFRPPLVALCEIADCEVGLPTKVGLVGIEASDLHPDSARKGRLALTATLKNRAPFAQQYPHLELTLTDTADKAIARKVLAPPDYLPPATAVANGMQPSADIAVTVTVDAGDLPASGYRLYIFYP